MKKLTGGFEPPSPDLPAGWLTRFAHVSTTQKQTPRMFSPTARRSLFGWYTRAGYSESATNVSQVKSGGAVKKVAIYFDQRFFAASRAISARRSGERDSARALPPRRPPRRPRAAAALLTFGST